MSKEAVIADGKIPLNLRAVVGAPPLKQQKFKLDGKKTILDIEHFLVKSLSTPTHTQAVYVYLGAGFSPTHDQVLKDLFDCFQVNGELVISYGIQEAWG